MFANTEDGTFWKRWRDNGHVRMCAYALPCIEAFLSPRQRFSVDATGLVWAENILCVFKFIRISLVNET